MYSTRVHTLGRYVFILHYHQPLHPRFPVQVYINGGRIWQGRVWDPVTVETRPRLPQVDNHRCVSSSTSSSTFPQTGEANASFCPHAYGCRDVLVSEGQILLDVTDQQVFLTVQIPAGKTLWLVSVWRQSQLSSHLLPPSPSDLYLLLLPHPPTPTLHAGLSLAGPREELQLGRAG